jgi:hypothetical protein
MRSWTGGVATVLAGLLAACDDTGSCGDAATCVLIKVDGLQIRSVDQVQLDLLYAGHHATVTTATQGEPVELPVSIPVVLDLPGTPLIEVDVIAAGRLGGAVLGLDGGSTSVQNGYHGVIHLLLFAQSPCVEGALYCGGFGTVFAESRSLYRCTRSVPIFYARCDGGCFSHSSPGAVCVGSGLCRDGGRYCGGNVLDGDPNTLYVCEDFDGIDPQPCPRGCAKRGDGNDTCL